MPSRTSTTLLEGLADPANTAAWRHFYARYTPMLLSYAKRVGLSDADAQDAVAETLATFVSLYRAGRYDRSRARLKSWLGGIAQNKVRKLLSRPGASLNPEPASQVPDLREMPSVDQTDPAFEREWQLERLKQALDVLRREVEPDTFQAFDLYALKQWPVSKVAAFLGMTPNAVYICKSRAIQRLRQLVRDLAENEE